VTGHQDQAATLRVVLCQPCYELGDFGAMLPGSGHDDAPTWGVAEVKSDNAGEQRITWHETGLTLAEAEALI
jgi:hypothetical protein